MERFHCVVYVLLFLLQQILTLTLATPTVFQNSSLAAENVLSRKKRFLLFPPNTFLTLSACLAKGGIILSPPVFVFTFDWDLAFQLPSSTRDIRPLNPTYKIYRRDRRDLYSGMEVLFESQGLNGRACVLRALCESQQFLKRGSGSLMEDIFHAMFTLPPNVGNDWSQREEDDDFRFLSEELREHDLAHRHGRSNVDCATLYAECPLSILHLALW